MSQVVEPVPQSSPATEAAEVSVVRASSPRQVVIWGVAASLCLLASGLVRGMQSNRYEADKNVLVNCPFPLNSIPKSLDGWHVLEGSETVLDPLTTRITGSTDHTMATYVDEQTGVMLSVLVLFGPAEPVMPHTPQVCYPSSGFRAVGDTIDRPIKIGEHEVATFRSSVFEKPGGREVNGNAVYHSFYLNGQWSPALSYQKLPRRSPGIFKVQIQRRVMGSEKRGEDEPIEDFIQKLLPVLEQMVKNSTTSSTPTVAAR